MASKAASKTANPIRFWAKNKKLQKTLRAALIKNNKIIRQNLLSLSILFQTIKAEIVDKINIIVQTIPITDPGGVQVGLLIKSYQPELIPIEVKILPV